MSKKFKESEVPDYVYCLMKGQTISFADCRKVVENDNCCVNFECKSWWEVQSIKWDKSDSE